jgi:hypothetical protein
MLQNLTFTEESEGCIIVDGAAGEVFMLACMQAIAQQLVKLNPDNICPCDFCEAVKVLGADKLTSH